MEVSGLVGVPAHGIGVGRRWSFSNPGDSVILWTQNSALNLPPMFIYPLFAQYLYGLFRKLQQKEQSTFNPRTARKYPRFPKTIGNGVMRTPPFLIRDFWLKDVDVLFCVVPGVEITHGSSGAGAEPSP